MTTNAASYRSFVLVAATTIAAACHSSSSSPDSIGVSTSDFVTSVASAAGISGVFQPGAAPAATGGPAAAVGGDNRIPAGGSGTIQVSAVSAFDTVNVSIAGANGFWQLKLPGPTASATIAYALSLAAPVADNGQFGVNVQVVSPAGAIGLSATQTFTKLSAANDAWTIRFGSPGDGLNVSACAASVPGGFSSQVFHVNAAGVFHEVWSPLTPVVEVSGTMSSINIAATLKCVATSATGTMSATGNGVQFLGSATLSGRTVAICVAKGNNAPC